MVDFTALKKKKKNRLEDLSKELEGMNKGGYHNPDEDKYWKLEVDSAGNGYAIIRFLDDPAQEQSPFKKIYSHGFQGPGGWLIDNCLTTLGKDCPVCEYNSQLWNSGIDSNKQIARDQKRRLQYVSNILVVHDPKNPDNNGKVFLFSYGASIFNILNDKMHPKFDDETPINPFDFFEGANFALKAYNKESGYRTYEKSKFQEQGPFTDKDGDELSDSECQEIIDSWNDLNELYDESRFKTHAQLKERLHKVLKLEDDSKPEIEDDLPEEKPKARKEVKAKVEEEKKPSKPKEVKKEDPDDDIDFDDIFADLMDD